jgi:uncharacterized PurR-regulated membrane protein YhhQ (DUF165 family)
MYVDSYGRQQAQGRAPAWEGWGYLAAFIATIFAANWLIAHVGVACPPGGPCVIPVWPGVMAPSGVLAIGVGFTLRDLVQRRLGVGYTLAGICLGALLSAALSPALAVASGGAFLFSEMLDLFVYTPLHRKNLFAAVVGSNLVGIVADSTIFLSLAFGSLALLQGQVLGKLWMTFLFLPVIYAIRAWDERRGIEAVD